MAQPSDVRQILELNKNEDGTSRKKELKSKDKKKRPGNI